MLLYKKKEKWAQCLERRNSMININCYNLNEDYIMKAMLVDDMQGFDSVCSYQIVGKSYMVREKSYRVRRKRGICNG